MAGIFVVVAGATARCHGRTSPIRPGAKRSRSNTAVNACYAASQLGNDIVTSCALGPSFCWRERGGGSVSVGIVCVRSAVSAVSVLAGEHDSEDAGGHRWIG